MSDVDGRLRRQILAVLGISVLAPACVEDTVSVDDGTGSASGSPTATSSTAPSGPDGGPDDGSPECGEPVSVVVCVAPPMEDGSTGFEGTEGGDTIGDSEGDGGSTGLGTGTGGEASTGDDGVGTSGEASTGGEPPGPVSCEGVQINDYSFCVYTMGEVFVEDGQCCQLLEGYQECCDGRPFIVHEEARTAAAVRRRDWCGDPRPRLDGLSDRLRAELAAAWQTDGLMEHASIASFARFVLHLVALGAPPELVAEATRAQADEIEHARACFALASAYAGEPVGPGPLMVDDALAEPVTLVSATVAAVREGCIGETLAAYQAEMAAARAAEPTVREALRIIAADEARHAALAWRFVAWALEQGGAEIREAVERAFAEHAVGPAVTEGPGLHLDLVAWRAHGRLTPRELADVLARGRAEIVMPCARALLEHAPARGAEAVALA